jgi:hypothetical protein
MERIEMDVQTGVVTVVQYTLEEAPVSTDEAQPSSDPVPDAETPTTPAA